MKDLKEQLTGQINNLNERVIKCERDLELKRQELYRLQGGLEATQGILNIINEKEK